MLVQTQKPTTSPSTSSGDVAPRRLSGSAEAWVGGRKYLATFMALPDTQGWRVGVVAPEDFYLRGLAQTRRRSLALASVVILAILAGGALTLRAVRRGLGDIVAAPAWLDAAWRQ